MIESQLHFSLTVLGLQQSIVSLWLHCWPLNPHMIQSFAWAFWLAESENMRCCAVVCCLWSLQLVANLFEIIWTQFWVSGVFSWILTDDEAASSWQVQLVGKKRWTLCPNSESRYLDPHLDTCAVRSEDLSWFDNWADWRYNPDYSRFPQFAKAQCGQAEWARAGLLNAVELIVFHWDSQLDTIGWRMGQKCQVTVSPGVQLAWLSSWHGLAAGMAHVEVLDDRSCSTTQLTGGITRCRLPICWSAMVILRYSKSSSRWRCGTRHFLQLETPSISYTGALVGVEADRFDLGGDRRGL